MTDTVLFARGTLDARAAVLARASVVMLGIACGVWSLRTHGFDEGAADALVGLVAAAAVVAAPRWPVVGACLGLLDYAVNGPSPALFFVTILLTARARRRPGVLLAAATVIALILGAVDVGWSAPTFWEAVRIAAVMVLLPGQIGLVLRSGVARAQLRHERDEERARALELDRQNAEISARLALARQLHDGLGHQLSLVVLGLSGVDGLLGKDDEQARELLANVQSLGRQAMSDLRDAVVGTGTADARPGSPAGPTVKELLTTVVERADRAGIDVTLRCQGDVRVGAAARDLLGRVATEGITNIAKHAPGATATVTLAERTGTAHLDVTNTRPPGPVPPTPASGTGLRALEESIVAAHGTMDSGPTADGGFRLAVTFPTTGDEKETT
ncbi:sensor histidine kinase [Luteimicrobium sp. DT211]|uniref:sensor histidine kinase n=1 Tax=Luteimicrobium sp. DT211 TaxID=3393412 RepID=UPI003CE8731C